MTPRTAVDRLIAGAVAAFGDALVSVVVHGSLAWGCWGPASDIDVLMVVEDDADMGTFHDVVVALDAEAPGNGYELSVLSRTAALQSRHPIEYSYHYSRAALPGSERGGRDPDLAGHLKVASAAGLCVYGLPTGQVFRQVTDDEFLDSVGSDVRESLRPLADLTGEQVPVPVYAVLNAARTLAWLSDRVVLSKRDGGLWLADNRPELAGLARTALDEYANPRGRTARVADLRRLASAVT